MPTNCRGTLGFTYNVRETRWMTYAEV
jgi:hypothetical protein